MENVHRKPMVFTIKYRLFRFQFPLTHGFHRGAWLRHFHRRRWWRWPRRNDGSGRLGGDGADGLRRSPVLAGDFSPGWEKYGQKPMEIDGN